MRTFHELRREVAQFSRDLHARGWVANHDGNVSARLDGEPRFVITPTAVSKRKITAEGLVVCTLDGAPVGKGKPPSEVALHAGAYRRPDVKAVIHAHPPVATGLSLARRPLEPIELPEVVVSLGSSIPLVPLLLPRDPKSADLVAAALSVSDCAILAGNGVLTTGDDLEQAYLRMELIEHYARVLQAALSFGGPHPLEGDARAKLLEMRAKAGLGPKKPDNKPEKKPEPAVEAIRPIVAEELRRVLGGAS